MTTKIAEDNFSISVSSIKALRKLAAEMRQEINGLEDSFYNTGPSASTVAILNNIRRLSSMFSRQAQVLAMSFAEIELTWTEE